MLAQALHYRGGVPYIRVLVPIEEVERDPDLRRIVDRQDGSLQPVRDLAALVKRFPRFTLDQQST